METWTSAETHRAQHACCADLHGAGTGRLQGDCQFTYCMITFACQPALHSLIHRLVQADLQAWLQRIIIMHYTGKTGKPHLLQWLVQPAVQV